VVWGLDKQIQAFSLGEIALSRGCGLDEYILKAVQSQSPKVLVDNLKQSGLEFLKL